MHSKICLFLKVWTQTIKREVKVKRKIFMLCVLVATMGALAVLIAGLILNHIYLRNAGAIAIGVCFIVFAAGNFVFLVKKAKHVYSEHEEKGKESLDDDLKDDINSTNGWKNSKAMGVEFLSTW